MSFTISYDFRPYKRNQVQHLLAHEARDVARSEGTERNHRNILIRPNLTTLNETYVNDGSGNLISMKSSKQAQDFIDKRLCELQNSRRLKDGRIVKVAHRKDANIAIGYVLQLDPNFTRDLSISQEDYENMPEERWNKLPADIETMTDKQKAETRKYLQVMLDRVIERVGKENVISVAWHFDETHPHIHLLAIPTYNGSLSYKNFWQQGGKYPDTRVEFKKEHSIMRERLLSAGYDISMERKSQRKHESVEDFKKRRQLERTVANRERVLTQEKTALLAAKKDLEEERESAVSEGFKSGYRSGKAKAAKDIEKERVQLDAEKERIAIEEKKIAELKRQVEAQQSRLSAALQTVKDREEQAAQLKELYAAKIRRLPSPETMRDKISEIAVERAPQIAKAYLMHLDASRQKRNSRPYFWADFERFVKAYGATSVEDAMRPDLPRAERQRKYQMRLGIDNAQDSLDKSNGLEF